MSERSPRYPITFRVFFDDGRGSMSGPVYDVSETGCFIETDQHVEPGTKVRIAPSTVEDTGIVAIQGVVVHRAEHENERVGRAPGIGVRFEHLDAVTKVALRKLFAKATWVKP